MSKIAFVSGCDANYFPLLKEWIHSIRRFPESRDIDICIIDAGLTPEQIDELRSETAKIVNPEWPEGIPAHKTKGKEYLKACVCRPFIPKMFPGYATYCWMDADTWVQDWDSVSLFLKSAEEKPDKIAVTINADRAYGRTVRVNWLWRWPIKVKNFYFSNGKKAFGYKDAKTLLLHYVVSAGCFALKADAPHWARWQELVVEAAKNGKLFPAEQLALGKLIHIEEYKAEFLPAYTHWLCVRKPLYDAERKIFVEPFLPHMPLGVLHLSGVDAMRADRSVTERFETLDGHVVELNFRYPHYDGGKLDIEVPERA